MTFYDWSARKSAGDEHEKQVRRWLEERRVELIPYGQGSLPEEFAEMISRTKSRLRWLPDFLCRWGRSLTAIDAKGSMRGQNADVYRVNKRCVEAGMRWWLDMDIALYYVFPNQGARTPNEIIATDRVWTLSEISDDDWIDVPAKMPRHLDDIFGPPDVGATGAVVLRPAA